MSAQEQAAVADAIIAVQKLDLGPDSVLVVGVPHGIAYTGEQMLLESLRKALPPGTRALIMPAEVEACAVEPRVMRAGAHEVLREVLQGLEARGHTDYADAAQLLQALRGDIAERIADLEARC